MARDDTINLTLLPDEVLFQVFRNLSVDDLATVHSTCKRLYSLLEDRAIWREVAEDILYAMPQPDIQRCLPTFETSQIRSLTRHLYHTDHNASCPEREPRVFHRRLDDWLAIELVPGGKHLIALGAHAELALLDVDTGEYVQTWFEETEPGTNIMHVEMMPSISSTNEYRLMVIADHDVDTEFKRTTWLLRIDPASETIEPLVINPTSQFADFASAGDNKLLYAWTREEDSHELVGIRIIDSGNEPADENADFVFELPEQYRDETIVSFQVLSDEMLFIFVFGSIALFHIPEAEALYDANSKAQPLIRPYRTFTYGPRWTSLHTSPIISTCDGKRILNVLQHGCIFTLVASPIPEECEYVQVPDAESFHLVIHAAIGCRWAVRVLPPVARSENAQCGGIVVATTPWVELPAAWTAAVRLPAGASNQVQNLFGLEGTLPKHAEVQSVSFDEWSGRVLVYSWDKETCLATFIDLAG